MEMEIQMRTQMDVCVSFIIIYLHTYWYFEEQLFMFVVFFKCFFYIFE